MNEACFRITNITISSQKLLGEIKWFWREVKRSVFARKFNAIFILFKILLQQSLFLEEWITMISFFIFVHSSTLNEEKTQNKLKKYG